MLFYFIAGCGLLFLYLIYEKPLSRSLYKKTMLIMTVVCLIIGFYSLLQYEKITQAPDEGYLVGTYENGTARYYLPADSPERALILASLQADFTLYQLLNSFIWLPLVLFALVYLYKMLENQAKEHGVKLIE